MFGGLAFLVNGHMCCGVVKDELMVRVGHDAYEEAMTQSHAREIDFTGRPIKGFVYVGCDGFESEEGLQDWVERSARQTLTFPPE